MPIVDHFGRQDKVRIVDGQPAPDVVFEKTREAIEPVVMAQVLDANVNLMVAAHKGDWETYSKYAAEDMLTIDQDETYGLPVQGQQFHKKFFESMAQEGSGNGANAGTDATPLGGSGSTSFRLIDPTVRLLGKDSAVVSYVRLVIPSATEGDSEGASSSDSGPKPQAFSETRIWQEVDNSWKCVHVHKCPMKDMSMSDEEAELASLQAAVRSARWAASEALAEIERYNDAQKGGSDSRQ